MLQLFSSLKAGELSLFQTLWKLKVGLIFFETLVGLAVDGDQRIVTTDNQEWILTNLKIRISCGAQIKDFYLVIKFGNLSVKST